MRRRGRTIIRRLRNQTITGCDKPCFDILGVKEPDPLRISPGYLPG
jgi:hypothetical protein